MSSRKSLAFGVSAIALALGVAHSAQADVLPVSNLAFNVFDGTFATPKDFFTHAMPTGWSIGTVATQQGLIYVGQQGSEGYTGPGPGNIYGVYTNPGFSDTVPAGTNFYQADGNPEYESTIIQTIPDLTAGTTYTLEFQQAAGQQNTFTGDTTEQWLVFLGVGGIGTSCPANPPGGLCSLTGTANNEMQASTPMSTPSMTNVNWNVVNLSFTPNAADLGGNQTGSAILTFLAWGDSGSNVNLPPTVFLEGVNTPPTVPEPGTLALFGAGLLGLMWRWRVSRNAAA